MDIQAAKNHLRLWMDHHGMAGTLDSLLAAQMMTAIAQAEATQRMAVAMERQAVALEQLAECVYMNGDNDHYLKTQE
jgi:hypothetical protein